MSPEKEKQSHGEHQAQDKDRARSQDKEHAEKKASKQSGEHETKSRTSAKAENKSGSQGSHAGHASKLAAGKSARTTDHDTIRQWIEARGGSPAAVKATEQGDDPGLLRINFPGYSGENRLEDISWDDFFKKFDEKNLAFLYQDETRDGETSRFWKFVSREGSGKGESKSKSKKS